MEKKAKGRRNPKLRLNKDSLRAVSAAALRAVVGGGTDGHGNPCPATSSEEPQFTCGCSRTPTCSCGY
jgi:hypothetical protein